MEQHEINVEKSPANFPDSYVSYDLFMNIAVSILLTCVFYALFDQILNYQIQFIIFIYFIISFFILICLGNIFNKADESGWKVFIPVYNIIVLLKIIGKPSWWAILLVIPVINIIISIWVTNLISVKFGKNKGFTFGLIILPIIFYPILAYGDSQYVNS